MSAPAATPTKTGGTGCTGGTARREKGSTGSPGENGRVHRGNPAVELVAVNPDDIPVDKLPEMKTDGVRPFFRTHDAASRLGEQKMRAGLYFHGEGKPDKDGNQAPVDTWICSPIHDDAMSSGEGGSDWGLLLRFIDPHGKEKEWAAPMRLLKGSAEDLRGELLDQGVRIDPTKRDLLTRWMMSRYPKRRITAATRTGWHGSDGVRCFVLPGSTIGADDVRFQAEHAAQDDFATAGTLADWRASVAAPCRGNPVLTLAVSAAFAGPLLKLAKLQEVGGAGIHLLGDSSKGKTTLLQAAASVWGAPGFVRTWRATGNGLEASAAALNDTLLVLDEISECDPREIGSIIYAIANGTGKQRAARTGGTRAVARWRILALSSGERTLGAHMAEGGRRAKAGQEARLLDLPATDRAHGAFDELHGAADGRTFADALKQAAGKHYGTAGLAFVERLVSDKQDLPAVLADVAAHDAFAATDGLEMRAAGIFALVGMAGELATEYGITGWPEGDALKAATEMFGAWREFRGRGDTEGRQILDGVRDFILAHGDARFSPLDGDHSQVVRDRAGYTRRDSAGMIYYLLSSAALQEAAAGYHLRRILDALDAAGWIADRETDKPGRRSKRVKVGGNAVWLYAIRPTEADG